MNDVIVVGTDGSPTADVAVQRAAALAKLTGAKLQLVSGYRRDNSMALSAWLGTNFSKWRFISSGIVLVAGVLAYSLMPVIAPVSVFGT